MSEHHANVDKSSGVKLDLTVNLPTILSVFALFAGGLTYINNQFTALNNRQLVTEGDVRVLQTQVVNISGAQSSLRTDTASQIQLMRSEVRSDLKDLKDSVETLKNHNGR